MEETPRPSDKSLDVEAEATPVPPVSGQKMPVLNRLAALGRGFAPANINRAAWRLASFRFNTATLVWPVPGRLGTWLATRRRRWLFSGLVALAAAWLLFLLLGFLFGASVPLTPLQKAQQLYNEGHFTQSTALLRQELKDNPKNNDAKLLLVQNLITLHQWLATNGYLSDLIRTFPNDPTLYYWIGRAQLGAGQTDAAINSWQVVLSREDPSAKAVKPRVQLALGTLRYRQGQYAEANTLLYNALADYTKLEAIDQQQAFYLYGLLMARDLRLDDATNLFQKAANASLPGNLWDNASLRISLDQTAGRAKALLDQLPGVASEKVEGAKRARLAYAYLLADEYPAAQEQLLQVLRAAPGYADARAYLGLVYWRSGDNDRALSTLNAALSLSPGSRLTRQALTEFIIDRLPAWQAQGENSDQYKQESERARLLLDSLINETPDDPTLQVLQARYYIARHDYQRAQDAYTQAVALNRQHPVAGLNPGAILSRYYSENNFDPCVRGVDTGLEATRAFPGEADSWYATGLAYSQCGHFDLAIPVLEKALELRPYWPEALYRLGLAYDARQRPADADRLFNMLADIDPDKVYFRR